jgi:glucuronosyltransferase
VEHVLATGGEAYLRTPDDELPLIVRLSLDVWAVTLAAAAVLLYVAIKALQLVAVTLRAALTTDRSKSKSA